MTMNKVFQRLRRYNRKNYAQILFCMTFSVMLITSFAVMLNSRVVVETLPAGGDSRKQVYFIFAIAMIGCFIFTIYAAGLFQKYKSKETGVFLALGTSKTKIKNAFLKEIAVMLSGCIGIGLSAGGVLSYVIWQVFLLFLVENQHTEYSFMITGYLIGVVFGAVLSCFVIGMTILAIRRTNLMDILYDQKKQEPLRHVTKKYGAAGVCLAFSGLFLGYAVPQIVSLFLKKRLPMVWNVSYLLSFAGIYMLLVYSIVYRNKKKNPRKFYQHIIPYSMMKFQGRQTVRNMCVVALLIACSLFAAFYMPSLQVSLTVSKDSPVDLSIPFNMANEVVTKEEISGLAEDYGVEITQYHELVFSELFGSGYRREWDDNGNLTEHYESRFRCFEFIDASTYEAVSGNEIFVAPGHYFQIIMPETKEGFWYKYNDLDLVTNPVTREQLPLTFAGTTVYQPLVRYRVNRYVLNDDDYSKISRKLPDQRKTKQLLFNVRDLEASYDFSKALYQMILANTPEEMAVSVMYDELEQKQAAERGEPYLYADRMKLAPDNPELMQYWKFYPVIKILIQKTSFQNMAVFFLVFFYVSVICLASVGIIGYTRSTAIGLDNKQIFENLIKLGANKRYITACITHQLNKLFLLPTLIGAVLIFSYTWMILFLNDRQLTSRELIVLGIDGVIVGSVFVYQFIIYFVSLKKVIKIVETP